MVNAHDGAMSCNYGFLYGEDGTLLLTPMPSILIKRF